MRITATARKTSRLRRRRLPVEGSLPLLLFLISGCIVFGCDGGCNAKDHPSSDAPPSVPWGSRPVEPAPLTLDLPPEGDDPTRDPLHTVDLSGQGRAQPPPSGPAPFFGSASPLPCPPEMVLVAGSFCIDRFETSLVDRDTDRTLSPHYPPTPTRIEELFDFWTSRAPRSRMALGRSLPIPEPPVFQLTEKFYPKAQSVQGVLPAGYLSHDTAELACRGAGKRLCSLAEWLQACRGQALTKFPYGDRYQHGTCNVHRDSHPAALLHGNSSEYHTDPRLGLVADASGPLLRRTGETPECQSRWGQDAIYDMVGNLDEWVSDSGGVFVGGFYARATREGCDALIDVHAPSYYDYSLGTRCCDDP